MSKPTLAGTIHIIREGEHFFMEIDGQEFPWHISADGPTVTTARDQFPSVSISILADNIELIDRVKSKP